MTDSILYCHPYNFRNCNPKNRLITKEHISKIFRKFKIDAEVKNLDTYRGAFIHESYVVPNDEDLNKEPPLEPDEYDPEFTNWTPLQDETYDRLEFLGDRVLDLVVGDYIYHRFPEEKEGFLTSLKTKLVRGSRLCIFAKKLKFDRYIQVSQKYDQYRHNNDVLEDVFEAFLGALFIDFGRHAKAFGICKDLVVGLIERYLNISQIVRKQDNYKALLLEHYHAHFKTDPRYKLLSKYGPTNNRIFRCGVTNPDGHIIATGEGRKQVDGDQEAAKNALKIYGVDVYSDSEEPDKEIYSDSDSETLSEPSEN